MLDRSDSDTDRLDAWLNAGGEILSDDDLTTFAGHVIRRGALPHAASTEPSGEQIERIRDRVFGESAAVSRGGTAMTPRVFCRNDTAPVPDTIPSHSVRPAPASPLSIVMTAAIIALIAIASFGAYRGSLDFLPGGGAPDTRQAPGIAPPVVTPSGMEGCTLDERVSVFDDTVPNADGLDTAVRVDADGTMTLVCDGQETEIANDVRDAAPMLWPGVIAFSLENETVRLQNLSNGASLDLEPRAGLTNDGKLDLAGAFYHSGGAEPWLITPTNVDRKGWRVTDLRSMETLVLPTGNVPIDTEPTFGHVTGTDVAVIVWRSDYGLTRPATPFPGGKQFPPDQRALVLPGSIDDLRWIDITEYREHTTLRGLGFSQNFSVSPDGSLLAYTTTAAGDSVIRIEQAIDGAHVDDVPSGELNRHTRFILTSGERHLVTTNGELIRIYLLTPGDSELLNELRFYSAWWFFPTSDPETILISHNSGGTSLTSLRVTNAELKVRLQYIPPVVAQLFGDDELPRNIVQIAPDGTSETSVIQLVDLSTGDVVLESTPVDAHPLQVASFHTSLRNEGSVAVVPIGYNRAIVMDANAGEVWEIDAPMDDDRLWRFSLSSDGSIISAWPEPPLGTSDYVDGHIAPLEPNAEWISVEGESDVDAPTIEAGTPQS